MRCWLIMPPSVRRIYQQYRHPSLVNTSARVSYYSSPLVSVEGNIRGVKGVSILPTAEQIDFALYYRRGCSHPQYKPSLVVTVNGYTYVSFHPSILQTTCKSSGQCVTVATSWREQLVVNSDIATMPQLSSNSFRADFKIISANYVS
ncbi:hypothetical protein J6590_040390 [Homalodisca vitripennis]|nr:hypothetical protein J6590_040390 [Homalodisca vitripennis]